MSIASSPEQIPTEPFPRRAEFDPGSIPVDFGDGVLLFLPAPRFTLRRRRGPDGRSTAEPSRSFGADFDRLVDRVEAASADGEAIGWEHLACALFDLAADLVGRNYQVDEARLDQILTFCPRTFVEAGREGELPEPWGSVWRTAIGLGPKSNGAGPAPPP